VGVRHGFETGRHRPVRRVRIVVRLAIDGREVRTVAATVIVASGVKIVTAA